MAVDPHAKAKEFARRNKLPWKTPPATPWWQAVVETQLERKSE